MNDNYLQADSVVLMRSIFGAQNQLPRSYGESLMPLDSMEQLPQTVLNSDYERLSLRPSRTTKQKFFSFQGRWKQGSLFIVSMVMKFSKQIKLNNNLTRSKLVTEKIYNLINDMASDFSVFERIRQKIRIRRLRRESLVYTALRKYIHELVQTLDAIMPIFQMDSYFSIIYMMVTIVLLIINITYIPLSISFLDDYQSVYFNLIPQVMFTIWILIHSNTTIYKSIEVITVRKEILYNYLHDSMFLEIMVVLPEYLRFLLGSYANVTLIFKIKLLNNLLTKLSENIYLKQNIQNIIDITKSIMVLLYAQHLLGCTFHFIGQMEILYYPDQPNWLDSFHLTELTWIQRYVTSIYWSIITSLTVGYGDITPKSTIEQLFVAVISLVLCGALGMTITSIGDVFQQMNQKSQIYKEQMKAIELELKKRNLNHTLQIKVKRYYQQLFQLELANNQMGEQLMSKLNDQLQTEVKIDSYRGFLRKSFILKYFKDQTIDKLCTRVKIRKFAPGTEVIKSKTQAEELIILVDGQLKVQASDSQQSVTLKILNAPSVIAEQQFVQSNFYDSQIYSVKYSTIAYIDREDFYSVLREDQEELEKFFQIRDQCLFNINKQNLVGKICDICSWTHGYLKCPLAFLQVDQYKLVKRNQQSEHQKRAAIYNRKKFRAHALINKQLTQEQAVSAFSMFHNTLLKY